MVNDIGVRNRYSDSQMFRFAVRLSSGGRVDLVNHLFGTQYPTDTPTEILELNLPGAEAHSGNWDCVILLKLPEKTIPYQIRCMVCEENESDCARIMVYSAFWYTINRAEGATRKFPYQAVLALCDAPELQDEIHCLLPSDSDDHSNIELTVRVCRMRTMPDSECAALLLPFKLQDVLEPFAAEGHTQENVSLLSRRLKDLGKKIDEMCRDGILQRKEAEAFRKAIATYVQDQFGLSQLVPEDEILRLLSN